MTTTLCPWLGTELDREIRHAEPTEEHLCYAQKRPAPIGLEHQGWYCLTDQCTACRHYRQPPAPPPPPVIKEEEDEMGPRPTALPALRVLLWIAVLAVAAVAIYSIGSALLNPLPVATVLPGATRDTQPPPSATAPATVAQNAPPPTPTFQFEEPEGTPTPYPGGAIYDLAPEAGSAGWVASNESRGNHLGDAYMYTGVFDGVIYHGLMQFDLSAVPRGATINAGVLELTGLEDRRLGSNGVWEVRVLPQAADEEWNSHTFQTIHNAPAQWSIPPLLNAAALEVDKTNHFDLPQELLRDLEQRLLDEHYSLSIRLDGPLVGENSLFAWASGYGSSAQGARPRLLLNVGAAPKTPFPIGTATPTNTPQYVVVTNVPTPANALTAAAVALQRTAWATTTGTPTPTSEFVITATPRYFVITRTPTPANYATASFLHALETAYVILTGTPTPTPPNLATATFTPRPTSTPILIWLDEGTATPTLTPTPTTQPIPAILRGKILFLSDRGGQTAAYAFDPNSQRTAMLTDLWPYYQAKEKQGISPDGQSRAFVQLDGRNVPQVYIYSDYYNGSWQVTFNTSTSYDPAWSPRDEVLAYVSTESGNDDIYVIGTDGKGQKRLTFNEWEWDKHPTWSPDGRQIVFWSNEGTGRSQIWIMNADGSGRRPLISSPFSDWDPVWVK